jgi:Mg2+/citrate symporter
MVASILVKPIFVYRYMLPAMGVFWLSFAIVVGLEKKKKAAVIKHKERTNLILDLLKKTRAKEKNSLP